MKEIKTLQFNENPYYSPEKCGLEIFKEIDLSNDPYEFELFVIWIKKSDGTLWWDSDQGGSYPAPFESARLKPITKETFFDFEKDLKNQDSMTHKIYVETLIEVKNYLKKRKKSKNNKTT